MTDTNREDSHPLPPHLSWGVWKGYTNVTELRSTAGWVIESVWFEPGNPLTQRVRWRYTSPEIAFEFEGAPAGRDATGERPLGWIIDTVGVTPNNDGRGRLPQEQGELIEKHCRVIRDAMPYWGAGAPIVPQTVRITDPYWRISV